MAQKIIDRCIRFFAPQGPTHFAEKLTATVGGCMAIFLIAMISYTATGRSGAAVILPSMGAATVLLFAVPHGPMSQPWALFAGNLLSAAVGVSCAKVVRDPFLAASLAVSIAIGVMHVARCVHPPGGATALAAVMGGQNITDLGYGYVVMPTLLNCLVIFLVALLFNNFFAWRRYPLSLMKYKLNTPTPGADAIPINLRHIEKAILDADLVLDIAPQQLMHIVKDAQALALHECLSDIPIEVGGYYSNDKPGAEWAIRQVIEEYRHDNPKQDQLVYKVVDGKGLHASGSMTRQEFALWMKRRVNPSKVTPR